MSELQQELPLALISNRALRWFDKRSSYRPSQEPINPAEFTVERIDKIQARDFIVRHHYSGTFVYEVCSAGLFRKVGLEPARLVGVAAFATPSNPATLQRWAGLPGYEAGAELGRFVCLDGEVKGNGETFFLARALRLLKAERPELRVIISYADPLPRRNLITGELAHIGHTGSIYSAANATYAQRADPKTLLLSATGESIPARILSKIRNEEEGREYATERLERISGLRIQPGESGEAFVDRALSSSSIRRVRHPGNHVYLFPLAANRREKAAILRLPKMATLVAARYAYPKGLELAA